MDERVAAELRMLARAERMPTPAILIDTATVERNIARVITMLGTADAWRPHVKTARTPFGMTLLRDAGVRRFKASTIEEVACLNELGPADVLLSFPPGRIVLAQLAELARRHPDSRLSALVDDDDHVDVWPAGVGAFIDIDVGMGRTGVALDRVERVVRTADALASRGVRLDGLHTYDGHLADAEDRAGAVTRTASALSAMAETLVAGGHPIHEIVVGSSHTLAPYVAPVRSPSVPTRLTSGAGTVVYGDGRSRERFLRDGLPFEPAAFVASRVLSARGERVTLDAGLTAIQVDAGSPHVAAVRGGLDIVAASQEHLVMTAHGTVPRRDELLLLLPRHLDTALSQMTRVHYLIGGRVVSSPVVGRH
jgi:D-serine deaminase-like pyridoxal phosphate-dependent protein